jgi:hypothetical protein
MPGQNHAKNRSGLLLWCASAVACAPEPAAAPALPLRQRKLIELSLSKQAMHSTPARAAAWARIHRDVLRVHEARHDATTGRQRSNRKGLRQGPHAERAARVHRVHVEQAPAAAAAAAAACVAAAAEAGGRGEVVTAQLHRLLLMLRLELRKLLLLELLLLLRVVQLRRCTQLMR